MPGTIGGFPQFGHGLSASVRQAMAMAQKDTNNFKVVVRVRPPLKREMPARGERDDDGLTLKFSPITEISHDQHTLTLLEYLG